MEIKCQLSTDIKLLNNRVSFLLQRELYFIVQQHDRLILETGLERQLPLKPILIT